MEVWDYKCDSLLLVLLGVSEECATGPFVFFFSLKKVGLKFVQPITQALSVETLF